MQCLLSVIAGLIREKKQTGLLLGGPSLVMADSGFLLNTQAWIKFLAEDQQSLLHANSHSSSPHFLLTLKG